MPFDLRSSASRAHARRLRGRAVPPPAPDALPDPAVKVGVSFADLPVAGLTRRRAGILVAALVGAWVVLLFARQVGEAQDAAARVEAMREANVALAADVEALEAELELIGRQAWIVQQARAYRLGEGTELPFMLAADAPELPADAPGSAALRLGATVAERTPLQAWLDLLFGPEA